MGRRPNPPKPDDSAAIDRALRSDSEALRYAEWWVRRRIYGLNDQETRWLIDRYLAARKSIIAGMAESGFTMAQRDALFRQIDAEMGRLLSQVKDELLAADVRAAQMGYYGRAWALDQATNPNVMVHTPLLPAEAARALVLQPYTGRNWLEGVGWAHDEFVVAVKRSLTTSLIAGEGIDKAAQRLTYELGGKPGQRGPIRGLLYKSTLIARTELLRASNLGALAIYERNQDVLSGWEWVAARDERTCPQCGALDGRRFKFGDPWLVPPSGSHPGCRCTAVPVLIDEKLMNEVAGVRQTYDEWSVQRGVWQDGGLSEQRGAQAPKAKRRNA